MASVQGVPLPAATMRAADQVTYPVTCPLTPYQEGTIRATAAMSRLVVAGLAGVAVSVFFLVLGLFGIAPDVVEEWTRAEPRMLIDLGWAGITIEHVRVAFFLGVFAGLYYAVVSATDPALRQGISEHTGEDARAACAARIILLQDAKQR